LKENSRKKTLTKFQKIPSDIIEEVLERKVQQDLN
jgi:hypothetical protein